MKARSFKNKLLSEKTLNDLLTDVRCQLNKFRFLYDETFYTKQTTPNTLFYKKTYDKYTEIATLLDHLCKFGKITDPSNCMSCKFSAQHTKANREIFKEILPIIKKTNNGQDIINKVMN